MEYEGKKNECEVDHLESNYCRIDNQIYKLQDYCISFQGESMKREIFKNGPVIGQLQPFTDFLAYKEGSYHKTPEAFKFSGQHLVKIVGWQSSISGGDDWIIENTWGDTWGENGYAKVMKGDAQIDYYSLGMTVMPYTVYDWMSMENMMGAAKDGQEDFNFDNIDIDSLGGMDMGGMGMDMGGMDMGGMDMSAFDGEMPDDMMMGEGEDQM